MGLMFLVTGFFEFERFWINRRFGQGAHIPYPTYVGPRGLDDTSTIEPKQTKKITQSPPAVYDRQDGVCTFICRVNNS